MERFKNGGDVMKFRSFGESTSSRIKDELKMISWSGREIE